MAKSNNNIAKAVLWICIRTLINIFFVLILIEGFVYSYHFSYKLFSDSPYKYTSKEQMTIEIADGEDAGTVAVKLEENGVVENRYLFLARAYLGKYNEKIQTGTYTLGPGMSPDEICKAICKMQSEGTQ